MVLSTDACKLQDTHLRIRIKELPTSIIEERFRVIHDDLHDARPVQRLHSFTQPDVTRTVTKTTEYYRDCNENNMSHEL